MASAQQFSSLAYFNRNSRKTNRKYARKQDRCVKVTITCFCSFECPCVDDFFFTAQDFAIFTEKYIKAEDAIFKAQTFERDDWTFVLQPLFEKITQPPLNVRDFAFK